MIAVKDNYQHIGIVEVAERNLFSVNIRQAKIRCDLANLQGFYILLGYGNRTRNEG